MKDEAIMSHMDSQGKPYTHLYNGVTDRKSEEFVVASRRGLDCK